MEHSVITSYSIHYTKLYEDEVFLLGQDLVGLNPDYAKARQVYDAYKGSFGDRIQDKFNSYNFV